MRNIALSLYAGSKQLVRHVEYLTSEKILTVKQMNHKVPRRTKAEDSTDTTSYMSADPFEIKQICVHSPVFVIVTYTEIIHG